MSASSANRQGACPDALAAPFPRGRFGHQWDGRCVAFVTTTGAEPVDPTFRSRLCITETESIVASNGEKYRPPDWWLNLQRQQLAEMRWKAPAHRLRESPMPRTRNPGGEVARLIPLERYRRRSRRLIPVVIHTDVVKTNGTRRAVLS
jgi:hypothetical protein